MKRLVPYIRTSDRAIQRLSDRVYDACGDSLEPYVYKQNLIGWPESRVFWQHKDGYSAGLAPTETNLFS